VDNSEQTGWEAYLTLRINREIREFRD